MSDIMKNFKPKEVTYFKREKGSSEILGSIQVSKGETTFKNLAVVVVNQGYYLVQFNEELPKERYWREHKCAENMFFRSEKVPKYLAEKIGEGIAAFKGEQHKSHLNPYSYLYGFVKGKTEIKLHELWSFSVD